MDGQSKTLLNSVNCRSDIAKLRGFQWNSGNSRCNLVSEKYVANYYTNGNSFHTIEFQESVICCRPINLLWETPYKYANGDYHYENTKKSFSPTSSFGMVPNCSNQNQIRSNKRSLIRFNEH